MLLRAALALASLLALFWLLSRPGTLTFSSIYVVNLPKRADRRQRMHSLASILNIRLTFIEATAADSPAVHNILSHVREERTREGFCGYEGGCDGHKKPPRPRRAKRLSYELRSRAAGWNELSLYLPDVYFYATSPQEAPLGLAGADFWPSDPVPAPSHVKSLPIPALNVTTRSQVAAQRKKKRSMYNTRPSFAVQPTFPLPWWRLVSPAAVACWHSHVHALQRFIRSGQETALVLEDDVDLEVDLEQRLRSIKTVLPDNWDLLVLGHCWSNEAAFEPLNDTVPALRPANAPKCNHAYAVTRDGALRLLRHLRSPAFAYSRAFDQALVHLIVTERIKAYSVYPSIVIQTKDTPSDIAGGTGSAWRDRLTHGTLARFRSFSQTPSVVLL